MYEMCEICIGCLECPLISEKMRDKKLLRAILYTDIDADKKKWLSPKWWLIMFQMVSINEQTF